MIIRKIAEMVAERHAKVERMTVDPMTILLIIEVVTAAIKAYKECKKKPEDAKLALQHPSMVDRVFIGRTLKKAAKERMETGPTLKLRRAFFDSCKTLTDEEIAAAFEEVPNEII